nr:MAG TPA: hypothetical protein [Crassvirales sp.]DAH06670.1 MAG TPA: hypothetical protein [Caudoviricetes sp.]DAU41524.1 MAG TPA: hypothetical protein [Bacteriophage sp.]
MRAHVNLVHVLLSLFQISTFMNALLFIRFL